MKYPKFLKRFIELVIDEKLGNRPDVGDIISVDDASVVIQIGSVKRRIVMMQGRQFVPGQRVSLLWVDEPGKTGKQPVIAGASGANGVSEYSTITADEETITQYNGMLSVKDQGIGLEHLDFSPSLDGHQHSDPFTLAGWAFTEDGILYSNGMYFHPMGQIGIGVDPSVVKIDSTDEKYRIWAGANDPEDANFLVDKDGNTYIRDYVEVKSLDLELMRMKFQSVQWAQHAIFDDFSDETKRRNPDPGTYDARVLHGKLDNGDDDTASRTFTFTSKIYSDILDVYTGVADSIGGDYLQDDDADWVVDRYKFSYVVIDADQNLWYVTSNTATRLYTSETIPSSEGIYLENYFPSGYFQNSYFPNYEVGGAGPVVGSYIIRSFPPNYWIAFCSYDDSTNGGYGYVKLEMSFDGGSHWQTCLDTQSGINYIEGMLDVNTTGDDYTFRVSLTNDINGNGPIVHNLLIATDPSIFFLGEEWLNESYLPEVISEWWATGGITGCVQALQPRGSQNFVASLYDKSGNGNHATSVNAPTWDAIDGWQFNEDGDINSNMIVGENWTVFVRVDDLDAMGSGYYNYVFHNVKTSVGTISIYAYTDYDELGFAFGLNYDNTSTTIPTSACVLAMNKNYLYVNGTKYEWDTLLSWALVPYPIHFGIKYEDGLPASEKSIINIHASAMYNRILTDEEVATISEAMVNL